MRRLKEILKLIIFAYFEKIEFKVSKYANLCSNSENKMLVSACRINDRNKIMVSNERRKFPLYDRIGLQKTKNFI